MKTKTKAGSGAADAQTMVMPAPDGPAYTKLSLTEHQQNYQAINFSGNDPLKSAYPVAHNDDKRTLYLLCFASSWVMFLEGINGMSGLAVSYFYKDGLKVSPATLSTVSSLTSLPWTCKPLYGFVSDGYPIFGYRRKPYLFIAGVVGSASWIFMSVWVNSIFSGAACMIFGSAAIAMANVIAEAMIVERSRGESQEYASRLQSIIWGAQAVGGIIAAWFGGYLLKFMTDRQVFLLVSTFPLSLIAIAYITPEAKFVGDASSERAQTAQKLRELWRAFRRPEIMRPCIFIFLLNATPATGATWFYFYTDVLKFSSTFLGTIGLVGSCCTLLGVFLFDATLKRASFRPIFLWSTIISAVLGLSQLLLVFGVNEKLGIPNAAFCLGESAVLSIVGWITTMPILVLAARLCPEGMEGTMYALIMSVNNLGGIVGSQLGAVVTAALGVTEGHLERFWLLVVICNLSTLLPLLFLGLIPETDPGAGPAEALPDDEAGVESGRV